MQVIRNLTDKPVRYSFTREDGNAYLTSQIPVGTFPDAENTDWFDLLPGNECARVGPFAGINWEPIQTTIDPVGNIPANGQPSTTIF